MGTYKETLAESTEGTPQFGLERPRIYSGLKSEEKDRYNADIRAINILLQGLPKDIYTLINHYTDAKDIWDNVKMLLERFAKLINDIRNIKMTMSKLQLNSKFMNNMLPEWSRYVTAVKLNRGLRDSNYDQLYAYLKQHETHAKENKMMLERLSQPTAQPTADPLALLSNVSNTQHGSPSSSTSYFTQLPPPRANSRYEEAHNRVGNVNQGQARLGQAKTVKCYNCNDKMLLMQAKENGVALDAEQLLFLAGGPDNAFDDDDLALNVDNVLQAEDCDAFDSDLKYQNLKDSIGNNPPTPDKDTPDFDSVFIIGKMQASLQGKDNAIRQLKKQLSKLQVTSSDTERTVKVRTTDSQLTKHYKELYDSIKITSAKHIEQVTKLTAKNVTLKTSVSKAKVQPPVLTRTKLAVDVKPLVPRLRNNRDAHIDYLRHLKESVETIRDIVEDAKVLANTPLIRKKQVSISKPSDRQDNNKQVHVVAVKPHKTNVTVPPSTGVTSYPKASRSQPKSNPKTNKISPAKGANKLPVEDLLRTNKSHLRTTNRVDSSSRIKHTVINSNSNSICQTCNKCLTYFDHDRCVAVYVKSVVIPHSTRHNCEIKRKIKQVWKPKHVERKMKQVWKPK
nr:hypothetical protein [Tanacetum cinerariifolium]